MNARLQTVEIDREPDAALRDGLGRSITYLRLSVTDRCNLRCRYCMQEDVEFLPKSEILSLEEMERLAATFFRLGVRKLRLTGGEPLVRPGVMQLIERLGARRAAGEFQELTLTTNGTLLAQHAAGLAAAGVRRVNVSLDTLDAARFRSITRRDGHADVHRLAGIIPAPIHDRRREPRADGSGELRQDAARGRHLGGAERLRRVEAQRPALVGGAGEAGEEEDEGQTVRD